MTIRHDFVILKRRVRELPVHLWALAARTSVAPTDRGTQTPSSTSHHAQRHPHWHPAAESHYGSETDSGTRRRISPWLL
jgi:hypothetical protein